MGHLKRSVQDEAFLRSLAIDTYNLIVLEARKQGITTQTDLVKRTKVSMATFDSCRAGRIMPSLAILYRISKALGCSIQTILPRKKDDR